MLLLLDNRKGVGPGSLLSWLSGVLLEGKMFIEKNKVTGTLPIISCIIFQIIFQWHYHILHLRTWKFGEVK